MKKSILRIAIVASIALLMACSNDDDKKSVNYTGTVTFFHYVTGSSTLSLESISNDRGLGTVEFESFGPGINLAVKTWDLTATDTRDDTDGENDEIILDDATFPVIYNRKTINALIGDYEKDTVELVNLTLAYDEEFGDDDNDGNGIRDTYSRYINFSSIYPAGQLNVYFVTPAFSATPIGDLVPDNENVFLQTVDFKAVSESIRLKENTTKYYLRIARSDDPGVEIYNSGEKTIGDNLEQTIIIAPYVGSVDTGSQITSFYYFATGNKFEKWRAADSKGQVRVFNAMKDSVDLNFDLTNTDPAVVIPPVDFNKGFNNLSPYITLDTKFVAYSVKFEEAGDYSFFESILEPIVNIEDGQSWTVIPFGPATGTPFLTPAPSAVVVLEQDTAFANRATITVSNAGYIADEENRKPYNVHITTPNECIGAPPICNTTSVDIPLLGYAEYGVASENAGNSYLLTITDETNKNRKAPQLLFSVEGGENMHFVFMQNASGGFQIVRLIGDASAARSAIDISEDAALVDTPLTITVTAKDVGGNKLTVGGDIFTLSSSSVDAVIGPLVDNNDGTYTATITDPTAEVVTISALLTVGLEDKELVDVARVTFTAP